MKFPLVFVIIVVVGALLQACGTQTAPFRDATGRVAAHSIALLEPVTIGGSKQWLLVRGANSANPILLFLHGGPGSAYIGLAHSFQTELEKHFVVVQWDQRGSGKSFPDTQPTSMTVNQFHADTHELVLWLRHRFGRDKIYLLGHSWGSYLGLKEAKDHPENLYAYVGAGQMIDLAKQEQLSHDYVLEKAKSERNDTALKQLSEIGYPPYRDAVEGMSVKYSWLWEYGGMIEGETGPSPFVKALISAKEYSLLDIIRFMKGQSFSLQQLAKNEGENFWRLEAPDPAVGFRVPIFFVNGEHDHITATVLIKEYDNQLHAPMKQLIPIQNAGHFAFFTHPKQFSEAMIYIRNRTYFN